MCNKIYNLTRLEKINIGRRLRYARRMKNWTVEDLAARMKMSPESISRMEEGDFELFDDTPAFIN